MKSGMALEVIGLLNLLENLQKIVGYARAVKNAPECARSFILELEANIDVFSKYQHSINEGSAEIQELFRRGSKIIESLQEKLKMKVPGERAKSVMRRLRWPLNVQDTEKQIEKLSRYQSLFIMTMQHAQSTSIDKLCLTTSRTMQKEDQDILHWITDLSPAPFLSRTQRSRPPGTNAWFVQSEKFKNFLQGTIRFMWIRGPPGCGKSVLSSTAFKHLEAHCKGDPKVVHALFYSSFREAKALHPVNAVRSLIKQIVLLSPLDPERGSTIPECVRRFYHTYRPESGRIPKLEKLIELLFQVMEPFEKVYLVADTLRPRTYRCEILETLLTLLGDKRVRLCVASRREPDIEQQFLQEKPVIVTVEEVDVARDIHLFCVAEMEKIDALVDRPDEKARYAEMIANRAKGNFECAMFAINALKNARTPGDLLLAVEKSGSSMSEKYAEILRSIGSEPGDFEIARRVVLVLSMANRSLRASELIDAIAVDWADTRRDTFKQLLHFKVLFKICGPLLSIAWQDPAGTDASVMGDPYVSLVHMTLREFLQSKDLGERFGERVKSFQIKEHHGQYELARICLTYLRFTDFEAGAVGGGPEAIRTKLVKYPFLAYAAKHWTDHFSRSCCVVPQATECKEGCLEGDTKWHSSLFLPEFEGQYQSWLEASHALSSSSPPDRATSSLASQSEHPLYHLAQYPGVGIILQELINHGGIAEATSDRCGHYGSPMQFAAACGNKEVVELFLANGVPDVVGVGSYKSALAAARERGYDDIADMLDVHRWIRDVPIVLPTITISKDREDEAVVLDGDFTPPPSADPRRRRCSTPTESSCTCICSCCTRDEDFGITMASSACSVAPTMNAGCSTSAPSGSLDALSAWRKFRKSNLREPEVTYNFEPVARPGSAPV